MLINGWREYTRTASFLRVEARKWNSVFLRKVGIRVPDCNTVLPPTRPQCENHRRRTLKSYSCLSFDALSTTLNPLGHGLQGHIWLLQSSVLRRLLMFMLLCYYACYHSVNCTVIYLFFVYLATLITIMVTILRFALGWGGGGV
jgi:hypothetical protein